MKTILRYTTLPLLIVLLIFIATCLITSDQVPDMPKGVPWDKFVHFGMFFVLSAITFYDYYRLHKGNPSNLRWFFWGFIVPVFYGGVIELMQKYFFSSRGAEWGDWIADVIGSLTAFIMVIIILKKRKIVE